MQAEEATEKTEKQSHGGILVVVGWVLLVFSVLAILSTLQQPRQRNRSIESLLSHPNSYALAGTLGFLIGSNLIPMFACLFGVLALVRKNPKGKFVILLSVVVCLANTSVLFLPSSEASVERDYNPVVIAPQRSAFAVAFPHPVKEKTVTAGGLESIAYESEGPESSPYLRAEFMQGLQVEAIADNFRTMLDNHARLAGLRLPEITETDDALGKVGTYSGTKKVGDLTFKVYGKIVLHEWSAVNCMVVEPLEVFPSEETVAFLGSISRR